ncbi:AraC family transcriptional regulator [Actinoplanes sp. NPDC049265]|uniref:AraC family transcriptional regulator n=1 Tax=Actinoplanes sp. NPDC049265 TaxID=3363902 RepID=UPI00371AC65C
MDVLSQVIMTLREGDAFFRRTRRTGHWGNRFGPYHGAGFHLIVEGGCWFSPASGPPVALTPGDVLFLPRGTVHALGNRPFPDFRALPDEHADGPDLGDGTGGGPVVEILCGAYELRRRSVQPLLDAMPDHVLLPRDGLCGGNDGADAWRSAIDLIDWDRPGDRAVRAGDRLGDSPGDRATRAGDRPGDWAGDRTIRAGDRLGDWAGDWAGDRRDDRAGDRAIRAAVLDLLLVWILRRWTDRHALDVSGGDPAIVKVLQRVHEAPAEPWTVQRMAALAGLSRSTFNRRFTDTLGLSPLRYVAWWRLTIAARRLRQTDAPLAAIAGEIGYGSEFAFAHAFKREFGMPAGLFRRTPTTADRERPTQW